MLTSSCSSAWWTTIVVFIGTALLTVSLQSSTASIGLGIGLAQSGLLPGTTIVPWVLGANLGITLTMMMAGWGSIEGRRLAIGSLLIKGSGALVILLGSSRFFMVILNLLLGARQSSGNGEKGDFSQKRREQLC
jgi:Na+/phosphate symporter